MRIMRRITSTPNTKIRGVKGALAFGLVLLSLGVLLPVTQAQVYLPGTSNTDNPPNNIDPDLLNGYTEEGVASRSSGEVNCGNTDNSCVGGLLNRFANPRVIEAADATSSPVMVFDWEIKAAQPPDSTDLTAFLADDGPANFLEKAQLNMYFNTEVFSSPVTTDANLNTADHWGPGCTVASGEIMEALAGFGIADSYAAGGADSLQLALDNPVSINQFSLGGAQEDVLRMLLIPHDRYEQVATISCPVGSVKDKPAKIAFQAKMMRGAGQRIATGGTSAPDAIQFYANIATNNLWYYPLDGNPAIVDVEIGAAGNGLGYIDLTFSEPIADAGNIDPSVFNPATTNTITFGTMADFGTGTPNFGSNLNTDITITKVTALSESVLRLGFADDLRAIAGTNSGPFFVFVTPPTTGITDTEDNPLHTGDDWRLAVSFDHKAPYVAEATVTVESRSIVLTFSDYVQSEIVFEPSSPPNLGDFASRGEIAEDISADDFIIIHYRADGTVDEFSPAGVVELRNPLVSSDRKATTVIGVTLLMPSDRVYAPSETVDIRIAQRMKDLSHPSLASIFDALGDEFKTSKFGVSSNFPRTVASAQAGSLQLRGREYELVTSFPDGSTTTGTGDSLQMRVTLRGPSELQLSDAVAVSFVDSTVTYIPSSIEFSSSSTEVTVTVKIVPTALDAFRTNSDTYSITPQFEASQGAVAISMSQESESEIEINRVFKVELTPLDIRLSGVSTETITVGLSDAGARLQPGDADLVFLVGLYLTQSAPEAYTEGVMLSSADSDVVTVAGFDGILAVTLRPATTMVSFEVSVTDDSLAAVDLLLLLRQLPPNVQTLYAGNDRDCQAGAECIGTVKAVGGRSFSLVFQDGNDNELTVLQLESGGSVDASLLFMMVYPDSLNSNERVEVELAATNDGITVNPASFIFNAGDSTQRELSVDVSEDADAGTFEIYATTARVVVTESVIDGGSSSNSDDRMLISLAQSDLPGFLMEVRPVVNFIPDSPDANFDNFNIAVSDLASGAVVTTISSSAGASTYILVPGIGPRTEIDAAALLEEGFSHSVGVCVVNLMAVSQDLDANSQVQTAVPANCDTLSGSLAESSTIELLPYRSVLYWVALDLNGDIATDSNGDSMQLGDPRVVYVAPPVGFTNHGWFYEAGTSEAEKIGVEISGFSADNPISSPQNLDIALEFLGEEQILSSAEFVEGAYSLTLTGAEDIKESTTAQITKINGVSFYSDGNQPSGSYDPDMLENHTLYSLGNDRITLLPQDTPLAISNVNEGAFLSNEVKTINFDSSGAHYQLSIYRYSTNTRVFEKLNEQELSTPTRVVIIEADGKIEVDVTDVGTTSEITVIIDYPIEVEPSVFELVVTERVSGVMSTKIRLFAVDSALEKKIGRGSSFADSEGTAITLLSDAIIQPGFYSTLRTSFAANDLLPGLPEGIASKVFDFSVKGREAPLDGGGTLVRIELPDDAATNDLAYYIYQQQLGGDWRWDSFMTDEHNRVYSAPKPCPSASASRESVVPEDGSRNHAWQLADEGLAQGHNCVLLEISDGGMNDADQVANGWVYHTGTLASAASLRGGGGSGAISIAWLLLLTIIVAFTGYRRRAWKLPKLSAK